MRDPERAIGFLKTLSELENHVWDEKSQREFQILLVKNRYYLDDENNSQVFSKLDETQCAILRDKAYNMTFAEAEGIIIAKSYVGGPGMRGRQSMNPLRKFGLVNTSSKKIVITDIGKKLLTNQIDISEFILDSLLKYQLPNPHNTEYKSWNNKPFISALRLIKTVNALCERNDVKPKGISHSEFGIFVLSLRKYTEVENVANSLFEFRHDFENTSYERRDDFVKNYIKKYLITNF
jgi:hypothetical protein